MSIGPRGENLIFLVSMPASGSTMLQRVLGGHSLIHTWNEPWIMLHPLYALRGRGHEAEYDGRAAWHRLEAFLTQVPAGRDAYLEGVRRMYGYLYDCALAPTGKRCFLDKTPRYYFIIPELAETFPDARILILLRNPLAVLSSILTNFVRRNWFVFHHFEHDLFRSPRMLLEAMQRLGSRAVIVRYEPVVTHPEAELRRLCERLGMPFEPDMIDYAREDTPRWPHANPTVYDYMRPSAENADKWVRMLRDPQVWRLCRDYLAWLGPDTVAALGYTPEDLAATVAAHRPTRLARSRTVPLSWLRRFPAGVAERLEARYERLLRPPPARAPAAAASRWFGTGRASR